MGISMEKGNETKIPRAQKTKKADYIITGKIDPRKLDEIPDKTRVRVYAIRDRKIIGSGLVQRDGTFTIQYAYDIYEAVKEKRPIGTYLTIGPDVPEDGIFGERFPRAFLPAKAFQEKEQKFSAEVSHEVIDAAFKSQFIIDWFKKYCTVWNPCIQVLTCSRIEDTLCYGEKDLPDARVRIYAVRQRLIYPIGLGPGTYTVLVAEGDTDSSGRFWHEETICRYRYILPFYRTLGYRVEVGQIVDGAFNQIYIDPVDELRTLESGLCEEIYINEEDVVTPTEAEGPLTGDTFKLTRIGNIPVGYIEQDDTSAFYGYANSTIATDSATLKVHDSAFCRTIKMFANIGSGLLSGPNEVQHYRLKVSYESEGATVETYVTVPFRALRESTAAEKPTAGPYVTETMGPIVGPSGERNVYTYPNPYDLASDKQWVYKGLIMVFNTRTLPLYHGTFTFTVEPLDSAMNPVTVTNPAELSCTILVDNTAPTASIGDIVGPYGQAAACGFLELDLDNTYTACDGNTRKQLNGTVTVPHTVSDEHENLWQISVGADYGDVCDLLTVMQTLNYTDTATVPIAQRPHWGGGSYAASSTGKKSTNDKWGNPIPGSKLNRWDQCAYQFRLRVHKRVTNGEHKYYHWDFTKHITIMEKET
jgi:hypothetical protein